MLIAFGLTVVGAVLYYQQNARNLPILPSPPSDALYRQANQPIDQRVEDLLQRMTLEEKIGQMAMVDKKSIKKPVDVSRYNLGAVLSGAGAKPDDNTTEGWTAMVGAIKAEAEKSRLGIPLLYGVDATHGHANVPGATVFPHAIGLGAAHNPDLVRDIAAVTSKELAATGVNWNFAPSLDAPEDIRWGRTYETFSSSPELNGQLGAAHVQGTQKDAQTSDGTAFVMASAKHFLGAGSMQWGTSRNKNFKIDQGATTANPARLDSEYLVPFQAAVKADVGSVMVGLNHWGEGRVISNKQLVTDKLKSELGFKGIVVSDWYGVYEFSGKSNYRANVETINAGVDMAMLPYEYKEFIRDVRRAVERGDISEQRIDDANHRILTQKFAAGLFDGKDSVPPASVVGSAEHRRLARRAVAESAVLLKNDANVLPLAKNTGQILVAGSGADNVGRQSGAWTVEWQGIDGNWLRNTTSVLAGIKAVVGSQSEVKYSRDAQFGDQRHKAPVGIVVVSEKPYAEGWGDNPKPQLEKTDELAVQRMRRVADRVVIVSLAGRPLFISESIASADAFVASWLIGSEGAGVADVLFGDKPFTGTLPIDWPLNPEQLPIKTDGTTANGTAPLYRRGFSL